MLFGLSGLQSGTTYFFRAFATNNGGSAWAGSSSSFTTLSPQPPSVVNRPANGITGSSANLRGTVTDPGLAATTVTIYYGSSDGGTDIGDPGFTFPSNQEEYDRLGGKVYVRINDRFGLSFSGFSTLDGRNTGDSTGASLGFNYRFADGSQ